MEVLPYESEFFNYDSYYVESDLTMPLAFVCASNMNRSMAAHNYFVSKQYAGQMASYGTGNLVRLPGRSREEQNTYPFETPYEEMYRDLCEKDQEFYTKNDILRLLDRNMRVKKCPLSWQKKDAQISFKIVFTYENRVFDTLTSFNYRRVPPDSGRALQRTSYVMNIPTKDTLEEAEISAKLTYDLVQRLIEAGDWEAQLDEILTEFQRLTGKPIWYNIFFE